jgi:hypothetical protein
MLAGTTIAAPGCLALIAPAGFGLAAGDHDLGALIGHRLRDRPANAARGAGDDGDFAGEVEQAHSVSPIPFVSSEVETRLPSVPRFSTSLEANGFCSARRRMLGELHQSN